MSSWLVPVIVALIAAGLLSFLRDGVKSLLARRKRNEPEQREQQKIHDGIAAADQSVLVVARARDELESDNARLRAELAEKDVRHAAERAEWTAERATLRREIEEMQQRWRQALADLDALKHVTG